MVDLFPLRKSTVLEGLSESDLERLGAIASERETRKGERLFVRESNAENFFIARSGRYALTIVLRMLGESTEVPLEEKRELEAFGWSAVVHPHRSIYSAWCTESGSLVALPSDALQRLMSEDDHLGNRLRANLAELIADRVRVMQRLWIEEVEQRMDRVSYWTHTEMSSSWEAAMHPEKRQGGGWRWLSRRSQRTVNH